jgi:hypothetical protein
MLSIIICSKNPHISPELEKNIHDTTGIDYELITIDNSKNEYSIFSAYNTGIIKSKYPNICFVHEDVLFKTEGWGRLACQHLRDINVGIIGIAGGDMVTKVPAPWSLSGVAKNFVQSDKSKTGSPDTHFRRKNIGLVKQEVVALDGVLLCMRRNILENIIFDDKTFSGFHAYDIDICLQSKIKGYSNYVVFDILIEHFSHGFRNREWVINMLKVFMKWQPFLPMSCSDYSKEEIEKLEKKSLYLFVKRMVHLHFTDMEINDAVTGYWRQLFPERSSDMLNRQLTLMRILKMFHVLGLKTRF